MSTKKKKPMPYLGLRVPSEVLDRLTKRVERLRETTGIKVNVGAVVRAILQEHA